MTDPTKEEQLKAALVGIRALLFPDVRVIVKDKFAQRALADSLNTALVTAIGEVLKELSREEIDGVPGDAGAGGDEANG